MHYAAGDRVLYQNRAFGTVTQAQTNMDMVHVALDREKNVDTVLPYRNLVLVTGPWHEAELTAEINRGVRLTSEDLAHVSAPSPYQKGDRVKLKYNRMCGTVAAVSDRLMDSSTVWVQWDKNPEGKTNAVLITDLVTVYAPRDTDPVNPNQEAIDAVEVQRQILIKEVESLQSRLSALTNAKRLLERG